MGLQILRGWLQLCRRGSVVGNVGNKLARLRGEQGEKERLNRTMEDRRSDRKVGATVHGVLWALVRSGLWLR